MGKVLHTSARNEVELETAMLHASFVDMEESGFGTVAKTRLESAKAAIDGIVTDYDREEARAKLHMNSVGYAHAMAELRPQLAERLTRSTAPLAKELQAHIDNLQARLVPAPPDQRDMIAVMIERRSILRALDPLDRQTIYLEACRVRDVPTWNAFETAASFDPVRLKPDVLAAGRRIRSELDHPDVISALASAERVLGALESAVRACKRHCGLIDSPLAAPVFDEHDA